MEAVHNFWRDHDESRLEIAEARVRELVCDLSAPAPQPTSQVVVITGWMSRRYGYRLSSRLLKVMNPGYRVQLTRHDRPDAPRSYRYGLRLGFRLLAEAPASAPPFRFALRSPLGSLAILPGSSVESAMAMASYEPIVDEVEGLIAPQGNVDNVQHYPQFENDAARSRFAALLYRNPRELIELAERDPRTAEAAAAVMLAFPSVARWVARVSLVAFGTASPEAADFAAVGVRRVEANTPAPGAGTIPSLEHDGELVFARAGTEPMPVPSTTWLRLEDATLQNGGTVLQGGDLVVYERSADPVLDFVSGQSATVFGSRAQPGAALVTMSPFAEESIT